MELLLFLLWPCPVYIFPYNCQIMKPNLDDQLYQKVKSKNIPILNVCEVGVYLPETSNILGFINEGIETMLVEPNPSVHDSIESYFAAHENVTLHKVAAYDFNGKINLSTAQASTFISNLPSSPALINDYYQHSQSNTFEVDCIVFSEIDNSSIDLLSIDTEGAEWYVLKHLQSRPKIICIETHGKFYINPFISNITNWMMENNYQVWYKTKSDTIYFKEGHMKRSFADNLYLLRMNFIISFRRFKKYLLWPIYYLRKRK